MYRWLLCFEFLFWCAVAGCTYAGQLSATRQAAHERRLAASALLKQPKARANHIEEGTGAKRDAATDATPTTAKVVQPAKNTAGKAAKNFIIPGPTIATAATKMPNAKKAAARVDTGLKARLVERRADKEFKPQRPAEESTGANYQPSTSKISASNLAAGATTANTKVKHPSTSPTSEASIDPAASVAPKRRTSGGSRSKNPDHVSPFLDNNEDFASHKMQNGSPQKLKRDLGCAGEVGERILGSDLLTAGVPTLGEIDAAARAAKEDDGASRTEASRDAVAPTIKSKAVNNPAVPTRDYDANLFAGTEAVTAQSAQHNVSTLGNERGNGMAEVAVATLTAVCHRML